MYNLVKAKQYDSLTATLPNHTRLQVKGQVYPGLVTREGSHVRGLLYFNITPEDTQVLHNFEGE